MNPRIFPAPRSPGRKPRPHTLPMTLLMLLLSGSLGIGLLGGCVYRIDVQQGNLLDDADIQAVQPGMTRNQVRFLLGTPVVDDPLHAERWDYMYYLRPGKSRQARQRWLIVWFDGDAVREVVRDVPIGGTAGQDPAAAGNPNPG